MQVYLGREDRARLERLAGQLEATKSDVLRRGLDALERQLANPDEHPVLRLIGMAGPDTAPPLAYDPAVEFGRFLEDTEPGIGDRRRGGG